MSGAKSNHLSIKTKTLHMNNITQTIYGQADFHILDYTEGSYILNLMHVPISTYKTMKFVSVS